MKGENKNMNKFLQKVAKIFLGLSMAAGIGVAINSGQKDASPVHATDVTSSFTSKAWVDSGSLWTSDKEGSSFESSGNARGVQVQTGASGAGATTKSSYSNVSALSITLAKSSSGAGTVTVKIGSTTVFTKSSSFSTSATKYNATISTALTGKISFTVSCTTNSLYVKQLTWTHGAAGTTYTVTYNKNNNGASGTMTDSNSPYSSGATVTVLGNSFTAPSGYAFDHWDTKADDSGTDYSPGNQFTISGNTVLYAQWVVDPNTYATYTPTARDTISSTGTTPSGSSATYYNTYNNANQMTSGNSITLTLSGYDGCTINKLIVNMKSNASKGGGSLSFSTDGNSIASISDSKFNTNSWYGAWSQSYVDISVSVTSRKVGAGKTVILQISSTESSIYFGYAKIGYLPNVDASVTISTTSTSLTYDGSNNQTVTFTATPTNFGSETVSYEWRTSNASVIGVTGVGTAATANLKILGVGNANITVYASSTSKNATSTATAMTVTNETYSGTLAITCANTANVNSNGSITYNLSGNTHPMDTVSYTSSNPAVINFASAANPAFTTGSTKGLSATVTVNLSSSVYSLETYSKSITITLVDPNSVTGVHFSGNITNKTVNFGGNYNLTAVLESESGSPTDTLVSWASANTSIVTVPNNHTDLTCPLTPVSPGVTTVTVTTHDGNFQKVCNVTVTSSATRVLDGISIIKGENAKTSYYDDATEVVLSDISLSAHYSDPNYQGYDESVNVANDAEGIVWALDLANEEVIVTYTVGLIEVSDSFAITVSEKPDIASFVATEHTDFADGQVYKVDDFTFTVYRNSATTAPTYNSTWHDCRLYAKSYMTIVGDTNKIASIDSLTIKYGYIEKTAQRNFDLNVQYEEDYDGDEDLSVVTIGETVTSVTVSVPDESGYQLRFSYIDIAFTKVAAQDKDVTDVTVTPSAISIESGETYILSVEVLPIDARDTSVTWSVTNTSPTGCVTVDADGTVHGVVAGSATVVATSVDQDTISGTCSVTVTQGPKVQFRPLASIGTGLSKVGDVDIAAEYSTNVSSYDNSLGAKFGSNDNNAGTVTIKTADLSFATNNLRIVVNAAYSGEGSSPSVSVKLGSTDIGSSQTLTKSSADYEFEFTGSGNSNVVLTNLVTITLHNGKGAVYLKSVKIYSDAFESVVGHFVTSDLRMSSYDEGGHEGSTGGDGSCKAWWNDVQTAFNNLTTEQKSLFGSEDKYADARARLSEWARINGATYNANSGTLTQNPYVSPLAIIGSNTNSVAIIVIISMVSMTAIGGYFFLRKRKDNY